MKNYVVLYYSKTGNSKFIAEKFALGLACDSKRIRPWMDNTLILLLLSMLKINIPTNIRMGDIRQYENIIIIGPVWAGQLVSPLKTVLKLSIRALKKTFFAVTCETKPAEKNTKYGYDQVLKKARDLSAKYVINTQAFSCSLVNVDKQSSSIKASGKIKITPTNYSDELKELVRNFISKVKEL